MKRFYVRPCKIIRCAVMEGMDCNENENFWHQKLLVCVKIAILSSKVFLNFRYGTLTLIMPTQASVAASPTAAGGERGEAGKRKSDCDTQPDTERSVIYPPLQEWFLPNPSYYWLWQELKVSQCPSVHPCRTNLSGALNLQFNILAQIFKKSSSSIQAVF